MEALREKIKAYGSAHISVQVITEQEVSHKIAHLNISY